MDKLWELKAINILLPEIHLVVLFQILSENFFMSKTTTRKIKLYSQTRTSRTSCTGLKQVPWLNVSGVWLEQAGFGIGDQIEITVRQNELIIKPLS